MKILTINKRGYDIVAQDSQGNVLARRKTYCNPSALWQIILDVDRIGDKIDWETSQVAKPDLCRINSTFL